MGIICNEAKYTFFCLRMNSASQVGDIFKRAGESYNKLGDLIVLLSPEAAELNILEAQAKRVRSLS